MDLPDKAIENNLSKFLQEDFVQLYIETRKKEFRLYTNEEVLQLPNISPSHTHYKEWQTRKKSATRIIDYLNKKKRPLRILEVGCGNGWLTAAMASLPHSYVTGIDINRIELVQAKEVFRHIMNAHFICTTIDSEILKPHSFDVIVFAASLQYFPFIPPVFESALSLLSPQGEIHVIDTHFYKADKIEDAKHRTLDYYTSLGFPAMSKFYFHHSIIDFAPFSITVLFAPSYIQKKLFRNHHPFYWIKIMAKI